MNNELARTNADAALESRVAESLVLRGDVSGLGPSQRVALYLNTCRLLGLNPIAQPFTFLRLSGKEVMYATRGATDQLAAIHKLTREIIDGPKVVDFGGTKLGYCVARVTHPNGRVETATATLPVTGDISMLPMKLETKAKRRATLAILGLALLDESEVADIPASQKGREYTPDEAAIEEGERAASQGDVESDSQAEHAANQQDLRDMELKANAACAARARAAFDAATTLPELVKAWRAHEAGVRALDEVARKDVWRHAYTRVATVCGCPPATGKTWLTAALKEPAADPVVLPITTSKGEVLATREAVAEHFHKITGRNHLESAAKKHGRHPWARGPIVDAAVSILQCERSDAEQSVDGWAMVGAEEAAA